MSRRAHNPAQLELRITEPLAVLQGRHANATQRYHECQSTLSACDNPQCDVCKLAAADLVSWGVQIEALEIMIASIGGTP